MMTSYRCQFEGCVRDFTSRQDLDDHMQQYHIDMSPLQSPSNFDAYTSASSSEGSGRSIESSEGAIPSLGSPSLGSILDRLSLPDNPMSSVGRLSERLILRVTDQEHLEDVTTLVLSDVGLSTFANTTSFTISSLTSLRELNLSHNYLSDLSGLATLTTLERLHLGHNMISNIKPLRTLSRLQFLSLPYNELASLRGLESLPLLAELNLAWNKLCNFDSVMTILRSLPVLESLQLSGNPLMGRELHMRYAVICQLQLRNLDGEAVTNLDFEIALDLEIKHLFLNESHEMNGLGKHRAGFAALDLHRSGVAARLMREVVSDRKFTGLLSSLDSKAKDHAETKPKTDLNLETMIGQMLHRLYSS